MVKIKHGTKPRPYWRKTTDRQWPNISMGLIRGVAALSFENDLSKDSERIRNLISMTVWTIWKSRNKNSINDQDISQAEIRETLKELISDMIRKSWNAMCVLIVLEFGDLRLHAQSRAHPTCSTDSASHTT